MTGAGIARDLSLRGLSVLLLEKGDWGAGTSGASSWMIHGGPRYLEFDWDTTRLSTQDAGYIVTIARNIVYRVVFLIPVLPHDKNNIERMETAMEVYDRFQPLKKSHPHRAPDRGGGAAGRARADARPDRRGDDGGVGRRPAPPRLRQRRRTRSPMALAR